MVDKVGREQEAAAYLEWMRSKQIERTAAFEDLEQQFGLDLDVLTDIVGTGILNPNDTQGTHLLEKFSALFEFMSQSASGSDDILLVGALRDRNTTVCTGFGAPARYVSEFSGIMLTSPSEATIEYDKDAKKAIWLRGSGVRIESDRDSPITALHKDEDHLPLIDIEDVSIPLAAQEQLGDRFLPITSMDVVAGQSLTDRSGLHVYDTLDVATGRNLDVASSWILHFSTEAHRRKRLGIRLY